MFGVGVLPDNTGLRLFRSTVTASKIASLVVSAATASLFVKRYGK